MSLEIEVSLKIPSLTVRVPGEEDRQIDNRKVRFRRRMVVSALPKRDDRLDVMVEGESALACTVTRADWHEEKSLFVVACAFARRSITAHEYTALMWDPAWVSGPLVPD